MLTVSACTWIGNEPRPTGSAALQTVLTCRFLLQSRGAGWKQRGTCSLTSSCARGWSRIHGETQNSTAPPVGGRHHMASSCAPLLGCCSNEEGIGMGSPQLKCCTTGLKISHISRLGRNPPPSSNESAALPATGSPTVPPDPSGFALSIGAPPIYHSSQSRAGASQRSSPPGGRLSRKADRFIHRSHVTEAEKVLLLAPASATERRNGSGTAQCARTCSRGMRTVLSRPIFV